MTIRVAALAFLSALLVVPSAFGLSETITPAQAKFERSVRSVVRSKNFYKSGRMELGIAGEVMPFDSLVNHYLLGGRLTWHLADHYAWEILDVHAAFPTVTSYTTDLAQGKRIKNLQVPELKLLAATNLIISPLYGKVRFFGDSVLHFDVYIAAGLGLASTRTLKFTFVTGQSTPTQSVVGTSWDPMFDFGLGFKLFLNKAMGLNIDFRDYVTHTSVYGTRSLRSNFSVSAAVTFFLPTF